MLAGMGTAKKITVVIEKELLEQAQQASGLGVTDVIREGLKAVAAGRASRELRRWRGQAKLSIDVSALRVGGRGFWERTGLLRSKILKRGLRGRLADTLIAQSCIDHGVPLLTRDRDFRHFAKYGALRLA
jgi:predicted nucleic acid-binding protein